MNHALIFAGGTGQRMNSRAKPKQFLELHGKPIIIYTIEKFEMCDEIDDITVVCINDWITELEYLLKRFSIEKVNCIVTGGNTGFLSIYNGLEKISQSNSRNDIVVIHDGVRPLITDDLIKLSISTAKMYGTSITVENTIESVVKLDANNMIVSVPKRSEMYIAKAPQTFNLDLIWRLYQKAFNDNIIPVDSANLCSIYGQEMHTILSTPYNIKITSPSDFYIFRALYEALENQQIIGI